jgi:hypothetical protein
VTGRRLSFVSGTRPAQPSRIPGARLVLRIACTLPAFAGAALLAAPVRAETTQFCQFTGDPGACGPYDQYQDAYGQGLRLTLILSPQGGVKTEPPAAAAPPPAHGKLNTIREVFGALRACFSKPMGEPGPQEVSATIRFSFTRSGEILGEPRFTYVQPGLTADVRQAFEREVGHTLVACMPLPFTDGLGGALAGRPFTVRVVKPAKPSIRS